MQRMQPPNLRSINLPGRLLDAWRSGILSLAKLPRGTPRSALSSDELLTIVQKQETKTVIELWQTFTQERGALSRGLLGTARQTVAYLLGFHLVNAARGALLLRRLEERHDFGQWLKRQAATAPGLVWYDLGCGTGALAHVVCDLLTQDIDGKALPPEHLEMHLYDGVGTLLDAAKAVLGAAGVAAKTHRVGLEALEAQRLVPVADARVRGFSLGYVWNELEKNPLAKNRLKQVFAMQLPAKTLLLIVEPATQAQARAAMELRDELVAMGYVPLYPCPSSLPCPMLQLSRDWCYSEGEWQQPKPMQLLDKALGIDRTRLNATLLAFASPTLAADLALGPTPAPVVVGRPERTAGRKGAADYLLCHDGTLSKSPVPTSAAPQPRGTLLRGSSEA